MRDLGPGIGLEVVGRKPVVLGAREDLEELPCAPRKTAQERAVASLPVPRSAGRRAGRSTPRSPARRTTGQEAARRRPVRRGMGQENEHGQQQGRRGRDPQWRASSRRHWRHPHGRPAPRSSTSSSRLRETYIRQSDRPMASTATTASLKHERDRERPSPRVIELPPQSAAHGAAPPPAREGS